MQNKQFLLESATVYDLKLHPQIHLSQIFLFSVIRSSRRVYQAYVYIFTWNLPSIFLAEVQHGYTSIVCKPLKGQMDM